MNMEEYIRALETYPYVMLNMPRLRRKAKIQIPALSMRLFTLRSLSKCNIMLLCEALYQSRKRCIRFGK